MKNLIQNNKQRPGFWSGALFGAVAGVGSLLTYQYLSGILRQPRLLPWTLLSKPEEFETQEALALFIASENLRAAIQTRRLKSGQYRDVLHAVIVISVRAGPETLVSPPMACLHWNRPIRSGKRLKLFSGTRPQPDNCRSNYIRWTL